MSKRCRDAQLQILASYYPVHPVILQASPRANARPFEPVEPFDLLE